MESKKISFAISVYNKLHELGLLVDVIRHQFGSDAYISVICNDVSKQEQGFADFDIDSLKIGAQFHLYKDKHLLNYGDRILHLRILDQVCEGFRRCAAQSTAPYIVHLHADAIPLSQDGLLSVVESMKQGEKGAAARGYGFSFTPYFYNAGFIDDMFLFAERGAVLDKGVFDFDYRDLLLAKPEVHDDLLNMLRFRMGARRILWYSTLQETLGWDGRPKRLHPYLPVCPLSYDPVRQFLHVEGARFLDRDGMYFYSKYLVETGNTVGPHIDAHLQDYPYLEDLVEVHAEKLQTLFGSKVTDPRRLFDENPTDLADEHAPNRKPHNASEIDSSVISASRWLAQNWNAATRHGWDRDPSLRRYINNMLIMEEAERQINDGERLEGIFEFHPTEDNLRNR